MNVAPLVVQTMLPQAPVRQSLRRDALFQCDPAGCSEQRLGSPPGRPTGSSSKTTQQNKEHTLTHSLIISNNLSIFQRFACKFRPFWEMFIDLGISSAQREAFFFGPIPRNYVNYKRSDEIMVSLISIDP